MFKEYRKCRVYGLLFVFLKSADFESQSEPLVCYVSCIWGEEPLWKKVLCSVLTLFHIIFSHYLNSKYSGKGCEGRGRRGGGLQGVRG